MGAHQLEAVGGLCVSALKPEINVNGTIGTTDDERLLADQEIDRSDFGLAGKNIDRFR